MSVLNKQWLAGDVAISTALSNATRGTDVNGAQIDTLGKVSTYIVAQVGASGDTLSATVLIDLEIEESDDGSTWTDAPDASISVVNLSTGAESAAVTGSTTGTFARIDDPAEDDTLYACRYKGNKRYCRMVANYTGTHTNGTAIGAVALQAPIKYT